MNKNNILTCGRDDIWYPNSMKALTGMPTLLYYKGNIEIVNAKKNIAIIGARKASAEGLKFAYEAGKLAAKQGINVVNGLALGCDTEAIRGALSVGGKCVAIMPCGLEQIQPQSNSKLADEIIEKGGCLISQYPVGTVVREYLYVERDRLQSGISQGVFIVEAREKSGTMHTADFAVKQYKRLACYYHAMVNMAQGNKRLEDSGKARVVKTQRDFATFLAEVAKEESYEQLSFDM